MWCGHKLCDFNSYPQIVHCVKTIGHLYVRGKEYMKGVELLLTSSTVGTYTGSCWLPNTVMYESLILLSYMVLAGDTDSKEKFVQLRWECPQDIYTFGILPLSSTISRVELEKKKKGSTQWANFDDTSKFCGEKYIGSSHLNIYRFSFASHLRMAHELSLTVYKVKACLLRLQCHVSSKI